MRYQTSLVFICYNKCSRVDFKPLYLYLMKILAFGASNSKNSINKKLAAYAASFFENADIILIDLNDFEMPIFSVDRESQSGHPETAKEFVRLLGEADLIIISLAEHNGSYSTAFKNIFDWASRVNSKTFQGKPVILMATSPGVRGGKTVLETAGTRFSFHDANVVATYSLPEFHKNFTEDSGIIQPEYKASFDQLIAEVKSKMES